MAEPPSSATGDIAFNLIVFFLVCASVQLDSGHRQTLPRSEKREKQTQQEENIQVDLTRTTASIDGNTVAPGMFVTKLKAAMAEKVGLDDKVVVVKSTPQVPYDHWIKYTTLISEAGGVITVLREEEEEVRVP